MSETPPETPNPDEVPDTGPLAPGIEVPPDSPDAPDTPDETTPDETPAETPEVEPGTETPQEAPPETTGEPETAPDAPAAPSNLRSEKELEKAYKELAKLQEANAGRVGRIMGDDATALIPCPVCSDFAPGFVFPPEIAPPAPETIAAVRGFIGLPNLDQYADAPDAQQCSDCRGLGWVRTGSLVENHTVKTCSKCVGKGYTGTGTFVAPEVGAQTNGETTFQPSPALAETELPAELEAYKQQGWFIMPPANIGAAA